MEQTHKQNSSKKGILAEAIGETADVTPIEENTEELGKTQIEDTPFNIVGNTEQGYWITMGRYRMSGVFTDWDKAYKWVTGRNCWKEKGEEEQSINWELLTNFITGVMDAKDKQLKGE